MSDLTIVGVAACPTTKGVVIRLGYNSGAHQDVEIPVQHVATLASLLLVSLAAYQGPGASALSPPRFPISIPASGFHVEGRIIHVQVGQATIPIDVQTDVIEQLALALIAIEEAEVAAMEERVRDAARRAASDREGLVA